MGEEIKDWTVWMDDDNGGVGSFRILFSLFSSDDSFERRSVFKKKSRGVHEVFCASFRGSCIFWKRKRREEKRKREHKGRSMRGLAIVSLVMAAIVASMGLTVNFVGGVDHLWSESRNWSPHPPGPQDDVLFNINNCSTSGPRRSVPTLLEFDVANATVRSLTVYGGFSSSIRGGDECAMSFLMPSGSLLSVDTLVVMPLAKVVLFGNAIIQSRLASFDERSYLSGSGVLQASEKISFYKAVVYPGTQKLTPCGGTCGPGQNQWLYGDLTLRSNDIAVESSYLVFFQRPLFDPPAEFAGRHNPSLPYSRILVEGILTNVQSIVTLVNVTCARDFSGAVFCRESSWPENAIVMTFSESPVGDRLQVGEAPSGSLNFIPPYQWAGC